MTTVTTEDAVEIVPADGGDDLGVEPGLSRWRALTDPSSMLPTYLGVLLALAGFVMLFVGWKKVAALVNVWEQTPYIFSAGLPGLGLVMTGLVLVNISAKRQDAAQRERQLTALAEALDELRQARSGR